MSGINSVSTETEEQAAVAEQTASAKAKGGRTQPKAAGTEQAEKTGTTGPSAGEQTVLFRDVLMFRKARENTLLSAEPQDSLSMDLLMAYRTMLINSVSGQEKITLTDAVCVLRDVLLRCHAAGQSWKRLALEINDLFDSGNGFRPFTADDLCRLMKAQPQAKIAFADPADIQAELDEENGKKKVPAAEGQQLSGGNAPAVLDLDGQPVDWNALVGRKLKLTQTGGEAHGYECLIDGTVLSLRDEDSGTVIPVSRISGPVRLELVRE